MIQVKIKESGEIKTLSCVDPETGCDHVRALVDIVDTSEQEGFIPTCSAATYEFWRRELEGAVIWGE